MEYLMIARNDCPECEYRKFFCAHCEYAYWSNEEIASNPDNVHFTGMTREDTLREAEINQEFRDQVLDAIESADSY